MYPFIFFRDSWENSGMHWMSPWVKKDPKRPKKTKKDAFFFVACAAPEVGQSVTRRVILWFVVSMYDPLGFL